MKKIIRTDATNTDFKALVAKLDADLAIRDGDEHAFYNQYNGIDSIKYAVVFYEDGKAVACGAIKRYDDASTEVKRMYTTPESRGKGVASQLLDELTKWAKELGYKRCILETGIRQPEAIALYKKNGFKIIENYGQYAGVENSVCFEMSI